MALQKKDFLWKIEILYISWYFFHIVKCNELNFVENYNVFQNEIIGNKKVSWLYFTYAFQTFQRESTLYSCLNGLL